MAYYDQQTSIKCNATELEAWRDAADVNGMPLNTWIRLICDHASGVGNLFAQLEQAGQAREEEHAANMRRERNRRAAEQRSERERRAAGDLKKRGPKPRKREE